MKSMSRMMTTVATTMMMVAAPAGAAMLADTYSGFFVLGDSLSDDGKYRGSPAARQPAASEPGVAGYFDGRFTNGKTFAEVIADAFVAEKLPTANLAYGGATTTAVVGGAGLPPAVDEQARTLVANFGGSFGSDPLVSILAGSNDIFAALGTGADANAAAVAAARSVGATATFLAGNGVGDFLIGSLPDLGATPAFRSSPAQAAASNATTAFNSALADEVGKLRAGGSSVQTLDLNDLLGRAIVKNGLTANLPCILPGGVAMALGRPQVCSDEESRTLAFFDGVHPNLVVHEAAGKAVLDELHADIAPVPLPAPAMLLLVGIAGLGIAGRRRA